MCVAGLGAITPTLTVQASFCSLLSFPRMKAFEVTLGNGVVLHSKLASGAFPENKVSHAR